MDPFVIYGPMYSEIQEQLDIAVLSKDLRRLKRTVQVSTKMWRDVSQTLGIGMAVCRKEYSK